MFSSTNQRRRGGKRRREGEVSNDSHNSSASASLIGNNIDILTLILIRLPSKSLLVFKSVSKQWLSLITDPFFVHKHFIQNPRLSISGVWGDCSRKKHTYDYIALDGNTNNYVPFETLTFVRLPRHGIKIVQSCNGLLLCRSCSFGFTYYIFNPFTKKYKKLPRSPMRSFFPNLNNVSLEFDPFKSPYYKVLAFWMNNDPNSMKYRITIYDSKTSSWRLSGFDSCTPRAERIQDVTGVFWNGSLYWCTEEGYMVYFDIDRELIGVVPLPCPAGRYSFCITEYGGHLYLIEKVWARSFEPPCISIYEMDAAYSCWNAKGQVDMRLNPYGRSPCGSRFLPYHIISIIESEEEKKSTKVILLIGESAVIVSYDLKDMRFDKMYDLSLQHKYFSKVKFHLNIESLACV